MAKKILNNNISDNGALMKKIADWFEKNVTSAKQKFKATKVSRAKQIVKTQTESSWDTIKYYLQQLHNANKVGINSILENFTKMAKVGLVDNAVLRKMEKAYAELKNDDKKFVQWLRKHPSLSSYFSYWLLIAALSFSTWGGVKIGKHIKEKDDDKKGIIIEPEEDDVVIDPQDDEKNKKKDEKDPYGNIALFEKTRSKIKFALAFVENYHEYIYWCGEAWTAGHGLTILYNADGTYRKVTQNTKVPTITESDVYKGRYLTREVLPDVKKLVKVPMDENTLIAFCVFRYCVGHDGLVKSQYLKQLNKGVKGNDLAKWFTRYRQQPGVQNRMYFFSALMANKITFDDLLDLRAEGCYNLDWKDIFIYPKDKQGKIKKDAKPIQDADGCYKFDYSKVRANLEKAKGPKVTPLYNKKGRVIVSVKCKLVKAIVPDYILEEVSSKKQKKNKLKSATSKIKTKVDKKQAFAESITFLQKGRTFDARDMFVNLNDTKTA